MTVLFISPNPIWGGAATANIAIAKLLQDNGNEIIYVDEFCKTGEISGVKIYHDRFAKGAMSQHNFLSYLRDNAVDVIIWGVAMVMPYYCFSIRAIAKQGIKQFALFHSLSLTQSFKGILMEKLIAFSIKPVDRIVYVSEFTKNSWCEKYQQFSKKLQESIVIHNPISGNTISPPLSTLKQKPLRVGYVGRFSDEKQPEIFCRISTCLDYSFYAWGEGPLLDSLINKYPNVSFRGLEKNIEKIYRGLDILIMTSKFENCPMVILEAMSRGIPCVVPKVGGISEIVQHGYNGRFFDDYNPTDILTEVKQIEKDYSNYSENCLKEAQKYTSTSLWEKWKLIL